MTELFVPDVLCEIGCFYGLRNISRLFCVNKFWKASLDRAEFYEQYFMKCVNEKNDHEDKTEEVSWKEFCIHRFHPYLRLEYGTKGEFVLIKMKCLGSVGVLNEIVETTLEEIEELDQDYRNPRKGNNQKWKIGNYSFECMKKFVQYLNLVSTEGNHPTEIEKPLRGRLEDCVSEWEKLFLSDLTDDNNSNVLTELIMISNELNIKSLLEISCTKVASSLKGKSPEQIRECFGIENDFTPEEEAAIREENRWADEF